MMVQLYRHFLSNVTACHKSNFGTKSYFKSVVHPVQLYHLKVDFITYLLLCIGVSCVRVLSMVPSGVSDKVGG